MRNQNKVKNMIEKSSVVLEPMSMCFTASSEGKNLTENQRWESDLKSPLETAGGEVYSQTLEQVVQAACGRFG